jgi:hypothetical protein
LLIFYEIKNINDDNNLEYSKKKKKKSLRYIMKIHKKSHQEVKTNNIFLEV